MNLGGIYLMEMDSQEKKLKNLNNLFSSQKTQKNSADPRTSNKLSSLEDLIISKKGFYKSPSEELEISILVPFRANKFKLYEGERFHDMEESITALGILEPLLVRPLDNGTYEILAGNNRWNVAKHIGLKQLPTIIINGLTEEEALLIATESNLIQRSFSDLSHSERAAILSQYYKALRDNGKRNKLADEIASFLSTDNIASPVETPSSGYRKIGEKYHLSKDTIARYIKINGLSDSLKALIDSDFISIRAGVAISNLNIKYQEYLAVSLTSSGSKLDMNTAEKLHELQVKGTLNEITIDNLLSSKRALNQPVYKGIKIKSSILTKYFNGKHTAKDIETTIQKALEQYFQDI